MMSKPGKRLHDHALPVVMIMVACMLLSVMTAAGAAGFSRQAESLALRGLTVRVIRFQPESNGLAKISLNAGQAVSPSAGSVLGGGISQVGGDAQMSLQLNAQKTQ